MLLADVEAVVRESGGRVSRPLAAFLVRFAAYQEGHAHFLSAPPLNPLALDDLVARATGASQDAGAATVRLQAAYDEAFASARTSFRATRATQERRMEAALAAIDTIAVAEAASAGSASTVSLSARGGGAAAASSLLRTVGGSTASAATGGPGAVAPASGAVLASLVSAHASLLDFCTAYVSLDPHVAGVTPAAPTRKAGDSSSSAGSVVADPLGFSAASNREQAAALESVFPRSALPAFIAMSAVDRSAQASDVARLALGVRLFNWDNGKGGEGFADTPAVGLAEARGMSLEVNAAMRSALSAAQGYVDVFAAAAAGHCEKLSAAASQASSDAAWAGEGGLTWAAWAVELCNRRQVAILCSAVLDEVRVQEQVLARSVESWGETRDALARLVGGRAAVSKDAIYPHFGALSDAWLAAAEARVALKATAVIWGAVAPFVAPRLCRLPETVLMAAQSALGPSGRAVSNNTLPISQPPAAARAAAASAPERARCIQLDEASAPPELISAPLELQGFCPVTLSSPLPVPEGWTDGSVSSLGVLVPGDPSLGLLAFNGRHYLAASPAAVKAFLSAPAHFVAAVRSTALAHPPLVHLLQLFRADGFPEASLPALARCGGDLAVVSAECVAAAAATAAAGSAHSSPAVEEAPPVARVNKAGRPVADAGVSTPVHFVDRHVDPHYAFSEWTLRRQALAIAHVRQCSTMGAQTEASHFRRDNDAQTHPPRESGTQTGISVGTLTTRTAAVLTGVRGAREPFIEAAAARKASGLPALENAQVPSIAGPPTGTSSYTVALM